MSVQERLGAPHEAEVRAYREKPTQEARDRIVAWCERIIKQAWRKYLVGEEHRLEFDDWRQEAVVKILDSLDRFNPDVCPFVQWVWTNLDFLARVVRFKARRYEDRLGARMSDAREQSIAADWSVEQHAKVDQVDGAMYVMRTLQQMRSSFKPKTNEHYLAQWIAKYMADRGEMPTLDVLVRRGVHGLMGCTVLRLERLRRYIVREFRLEFRRQVE